MDLLSATDTSLIEVPPPADFQDWSRTCRYLVSRNMRPEQLTFRRNADEAGDLLHSAGQLLQIEKAPALSVPRAYGEAAAQVFCHRSDEALPLLYRVLWRVLHENRDLVEIATDADVYQFLQMAKAVKRDIHKMHAFVRFRKHVMPDGSEHYTAWHRPDHLIVRAAAPFFRDRFSVMHWSILTPDKSVHWDTRELTFSAGVARDPIGTDAIEDVWRTYYASTFNPARVSVKAMKKELPVRHWATLPEAQLIPGLVEQSSARAEKMIAEQTISAREFLPEVRTLDTLRVAVQKCQGCPLYKNATQAIFGHGPADARVVFVGEQPGDNEDLTGKPFVGPSGQLLDRAFAEAGIDRNAVYMTGAVRHFKHEIIGKKRIHRNPNRAEIAACRPWILEELKIIQPTMIVCLGVSAAVSILGRQVTLKDWRGRFFGSSLAAETFVTSHPAAILRAGDAEAQASAYQLFVDELRQVAHKISALDLCASSQDACV